MTDFEKWWDGLPTAVLADYRDTARAAWNAATERAAKKCDEAAKLAMGTRFNRSDPSQRRECEAKANAADFLAVAIRREES